MLQPVAHVKDGFTLIEFLVALLIMTVGFGPAEVGKCVNHAKFQQQEPEFCSNVS